MNELSRTIGFLALMVLLVWAGWEFFAGDRSTGVLIWLVTFAIANTADRVARLEKRSRP